MEHQGAHEVGGAPRGVGAPFGEHSNFKKFPTHTQDHGDAQQREGRVLSMYPRRPEAEAL